MYFINWHLYFSLHIKILFRPKLFLSNLNLVTFYIHVLLKYIDALQHGSTKQMHLTVNVENVLNLCI